MIVRDFLPRIFSHLWLGPKSAISAFFNGVIMFKAFHVKSDKAVTSAPVSTLTETG